MQNSKGIISKRSKAQLFVWLFTIAFGGSFLYIYQLPQEARMAALSRMRGAHATPVKYLDLKTLLSGIECDRAGFNVYVTCPCGVLGLGLNNFNFPWPVLALARGLPAQLTEKDADWIGPWLIGSFLLSLGLMFEATSMLQALFYCALIASSTIRLALDRANYDLAIFILIFVTIALVDRMSNLAGYAAIFGIGMLKLYPIAAILGVVRRGKRSLVLLGSAVVLEFLFVLFSLKNLRMVAALTAQTWNLSFGSPVLFLYLGEEFMALTWLPHLRFPALAVSIALIVYVAFRQRDLAIPLLSCGNPKLRPLFLAGAAIFASVFVVGTSYNYRLIFLLFTVPYLFSVRQTALRRSEDYAWQVSSIVLSLVLLVFWLASSNHYFALTVAASVMTWVLFCFYGSLCVIFARDSILGFKDQ